MFDNSPELTVFAQLQEDVKHDEGEHVTEAASDPKPSIK